MAGSLLHFPRRIAAARSGQGGRAAPGAGCWPAPGRDGPLAVYRPDGRLRSEWWFQAGDTHRLDGPAYIRHFEDGSRLEQWYRCNLRHRTDGPAVVERMSDGGLRKAQWWIGGNDVTAEAEAFLAETRGRWPLDAAQQAAFLRRCAGEWCERSSAEASMSLRPIVMGVCAAGVLWLPVILAVALLWD